MVMTRRPNKGMEPTPYSLRSYVAPASGRGSCPALGCERLGSLRLALMSIGFRGFPSLMTELECKSPPRRSIYGLQIERIRRDE
jgi:hypothetical protein